mgnify:CR=1 FL=1
MEPDTLANELYWESDRSVNQIADEMEGLTSGLDSTAFEEIEERFARNAAVAAEAGVPTD